MARFHPGKLMTNQMIPGGSCWNTPADTASPIREEAPWAGIPKCFPGENPMVSHIRMVDFPHLCYWLVVYLPLWKIWKSVGVIILNIWKNKKCSQPPTRSYSLLEGKYPLVVSHSYGKFLTLFILWLEPWDRRCGDTVHKHLAWDGLRFCNKCTKPNQWEKYHEISWNSTLCRP